MVPHFVEKSIKDLEQLDRFLEAFFPDENEQIHFRAFKPKGAVELPFNKPAKISTTRQNLKLEKNQRGLIDLNQHCGLYFVINSGGDKDAEISRFNAFLCERDDLPIEEQHRLHDAAPIQPSIRIETARSIHAYWLLHGDCTEQEWREVQAMLIAYFKSDPTIKNPSRVMRLPFFNHLSIGADDSYQYKTVELVRFEPERRFTVAEMLQAFSTSTEIKTEANHFTGYQSWDALWAEWGNRLRQHPSAKRNSSGNWDCRGICHDGKGDSGLVYFLSTNRGHCNKGCDESKVLRAFDMPVNLNGLQFGNQQQSISDDALEPLAKLGKGAMFNEIESAIRHFASRLISCDALKREVSREAAIKMLKELGVSRPSRIIDAAMPKHSFVDNEDSSKLICLKEPELWNETVDGSHLLFDIVQTLLRFLSAKEDHFITVALWVFYAHTFNAFDISPILAITSPEKRCGKTTLLTLLDALVPMPLAVSNITASALFRTIEKYHPTLLVDEADSFVTGDETLRGIVNSGHTRQTAYVIRTVGEDYEPRMFTTWAPKVIAMIGSPKDTIQDRAIIIKMQRKQADEMKERLRFDRMEEFEALRRRAARWAADSSNRLRAMDVDVPMEISNDRARDNWRVLITIADCIGGEWPTRAREIACRLAGVELALESPRTLLLQDLRSIFDEKGDDLPSEEIVNDLNEMEHRPWAEWRAGKPLTKVGLAKLLKPFDINPDKWREGKVTIRGYHREEFREIFSRYLGNKTPHSPQGLDSITYEDSQSPQPDLFVATTNNDKCLKTKDVASVATQKEEAEEEEVFTV